MNGNWIKAAVVTGLSFISGLFILGTYIHSSVDTFKQYERTVTVRGLSEQEHRADIVIWPIQFTEASNDLQEIYTSLDEGAEKIRSFLIDSGLTHEEISVSSPVVTDRSAQRYGTDGSMQFRYVATHTVTVYSDQIEKVREIMSSIADLGRQGITISGDEFSNRTEYLFTRLNDVKPMMIEEATIEARKVAEKFAEDSNSKLGKIKTASQGLFTISPRDNNNPHIKKVRVVSTIVYYLTD
ncbi:SIMPL domain-containing protein [Rhodohalobacter mucosus]|uniref:SIMPL domain-containing protein n=1 Tax=Rhodohalobacter mucosus TaxID=2079485 RepID=A0A316TMY2_9BACT|nr:SIMPL domain-containing protein [Rhodohalobacter mucosus]PWN05957.1 hypothetical protein DDZ15_12305 [Rhodohalobacter mucosus]